MGAEPFSRAKSYLGAESFSRAESFFREAAVVLLLIYREICRKESHIWGWSHFEGGVIFGAEPFSRAESYLGAAAAVVLLLIYREIKSFFLIN